MRTEEKAYGGGLGSVACSSVNHDDDDDSRAEDISLRTLSPLWPVECYKLNPD